MLLLLAQSMVFAQTDTTTIVTEIDTSFVESVLNRSDEASPERITSLPDTPVFRSVPDSVISALQRRREFAYANDPAYWTKEKKRNTFSWFDKLISSKLFRYLVLSILVGLLLFAVVKIAMSNRLFILRRSKRSGSSEEDELLQKENLPALITEAEAAGNFRLAVRYRYMKTLQDMDQRQLIQLNSQSTNWDYVNRLGGHPLKKQFLLLTRAYEYVWYGEFNITEQQYSYLKTEFQQFENSLI